MFGRADPRPAAARQRRGFYTEMISPRNRVTEPLGVLVWPATCVGPMLAEITFVSDVKKDMSRTSPLLFWGSAGARCNFGAGQPEPNMLCVCVFPVMVGSIVCGRDAQEIV